MTLCGAPCQIPLSPVAQHAGSHVHFAKEARNQSAYAAAGAHAKCRVHFKAGQRETQVNVSTVPQSRKRTNSQFTCRKESVSDGTDNAELAVACYSKRS